jgi:prepilin-type processing-associated H-X9-DG protein
MEQVTGSIRCFSEIASFIVTDTINDAFFICTGTMNGGTTWGDYPAALHNGACGFAFSDGHSEIHKWKNNGGLRKVNANNSVPPAIADKVDANWYNRHSVEAR